MLSVIYSRLKQVFDSHQPIREAAVHEIIKIIEFNNIAGKQDDVLDKALKIALNDAAQIQIAEELADLYLAHDVRPPEVFWILGKLKPIATITGIEKIVQMAANSFDDARCYQALIALENALFDSSILSDRADKNRKLTDFFENLPINYSQKTLAILHRLTGKF
jgi:hypothetical protein